MIPASILAHIEQLESEASQFEEQARACHDAAALLRERFGGPPKVKAAHDDLRVLAERALNNQIEAGRKQGARTIVLSDAVPKRPALIRMILREAGKAMTVPEIAHQMGTRGDKVLPDRNVYLSVVRNALTRNKDKWVSDLGNGLWEYKEYEENGDEEESDEDD